MKNDASSYKKVTAIAIGFSVIFTILILIHYRQISARGGTIIIPAGNSYLGPVDTPTPTPTANNTVWRTIHGRIYPYTFDVPSSVNLTTFPNDPYDIYALTGNNIAPESNVLIVVDNLSKDPAKRQYINQSKTVYINAWWKQFNNLTGVKSIEPFTNSKGLKGYTVKFLAGGGPTSNTDVFFEVATAPQYVIHLTNGILDSAVFAKIVDSVTWK